MCLSSKWLCLVTAAVTSTAVLAIPADYAAARSDLIQREQELRIGGSGATLSPQEKIVDNMLRTEKKQLIEAARLKGFDFASRHCFVNETARKAMENTQAFKIIKKMPKGGILHIHDEAITSIAWLVSNVTYRPDCYMCFTSNLNVQFHFFSSLPTNANCTWKLVSEMRAASGDSQAFDKSLFANLSMVKSDPSFSYPNIHAVWARFMDYFGKVEGLMLYAPVFRDYLWQGLLECREDNVQYIEIRGLLPEVYELDGTVHTHDWVLNVYREVISDFVKVYPDFSGGRFIKTSLRFKSAEEINAEVQEAVRLYQDNSDFLVGFDLVGQEDPLNPLRFYIDSLLAPSQQQPPVHLPYFFHAGETYFQGTPSDLNLVDAILLNTTRIGHGYALYKHPVLMQKIKERGIAVEVNPVSNQVLGLVLDPRNHPAVPLIAENYPLVISSDDPPAWEALPLTHDFYVTFMALTDQDAGLSTLKELALNSLRYSALPEAEKQMAISNYQQRWNRFIQDTIPTHDSMASRVDYSRVLVCCVQILVVFYRL